MTLQTMIEFTVPDSLQTEHEDLHTMLEKAKAEPGALGQAAHKLGRLMHPHMMNEEAFAMPPLGLLARLAKGELNADMADIVFLTERLKTEMPQMLRAHAQIFDSLQQFVAAAKASGKMQYAEFAERLMVHALLEEEVLYPAAILVGEYLKLRLRN